MMLVLGEGLETEGEGLGDTGDTLGCDIGAGAAARPCSHIERHMESQK